MTNYDLEDTNTTDRDASSKNTSLTSARTTLEERLREAGLTAERCIPFVDGRKTPPRGFSNHNDPEKHDIPSAYEGNYAVHAGRNLITIDIDDREELPKQLQNLPETFTTNTPHGGVHLYYSTEDDEGISDTTGPWGEIKYGGIPALGPGSTLDHSVACDGNKDNCPGVGVDRYELEDRPIHPLEDTTLAGIRELCEESSTTSRTKSNAPTDAIKKPDEVRAEQETEWLCGEFLPKYAGKAMNESLLDILKGGFGHFDWRPSNDSSSLDRSRLNIYALSMLYGAFRERGDDEDEARHNALAVFKNFCLENEWDVTGNRRKWLTKGEQYLQNTMDSAEEQFNRERWLQRLRKEYKDGFDADEHQPWLDRYKRNKPSDITEDTVLATVWLLSGPFTAPLPVEDASAMFSVDLSTPQTVNKYVPPRRRRADDSGEAALGTYRERKYPTAREVAGLAAELNTDRSEEYFGEVVRKLTRGAVLNRHTAAR
ncbi:hypothetical protein B9H04_12020 [Halorubrum ezzemoulense DSM 17463]|uniref:DNA primase/polymerase bifunctional N-terminal domain-containing protein n=1 Tax=Halorubrum ezzemoulense DSM 17463 TaxID=1121945 RepID=A0A1X4GKC7_HALEZ|nr:bifunctional DNA primase/polymerase [Halorubrum ezzemoulense]OSO97642.1 hypothetical protein B9H04_12020 [Halorubrum ezzemoulense DSM 17463]